MSDIVMAIATLAIWMAGAFFGCVYMIQLDEAAKTAPPVTAKP